MIVVKRGRFVPLIQALGSRQSFPVHEMGPAVVRLVFQAVVPISRWPSCRDGRHKHSSLVRASVADTTK